MFQVKRCAFEAGLKGGVEWFLLIAVLCGGARSANHLQ
jgi:hypothetical protein